MLIPNDVILLYDWYSAMQCFIIMCSHHRQYVWLLSALCRSFYTSVWCYIFCYLLFLVMFSSSFPIKCYVCCAKCQTCKYNGNATHCKHIIQSSSIYHQNFKFGGHSFYFIHEFAAVIHSNFYRNLYVWMAMVLNTVIFCTHTKKILTLYLKHIIY